MKSNGLHSGFVLTACLPFSASAVECVVAPQGAPAAAEAACSYGGGRRCSTHQVDWAVRQGWGKGGNSAISVSADKILHKVCYVCPLSACLPAGWRLHSWLQLRN